MKHKLIFNFACSSTFVSSFVYWGIFLPFYWSEAVCPISVHTQEECVFTWICSGVHWSRLTDLTLEMCTPRLRWIPAQRIHMNTPRFQEAHRGPETVENVCDFRALRNHCTTDLQRVQALWLTRDVWKMQKWVMVKPPTDSTGFL